jgi:hypothetical protein
LAQGKVRGKKLIRIVRKIKPVAVWLPDEERILIDSSLPVPEQESAALQKSGSALLLDQALV